MFSVGAFRLLVYFNKCFNNNINTDILRSMKSLDYCNVQKVIEILIDKLNWQLKY